MSIVQGKSSAGTVPEPLHRSRNHWLGFHRLNPVFHRLWLLAATSADPDADVGTGDCDTLRSGAEWSESHVIWVIATDPIRLLPDLRIWDRRSFPSGCRRGIGCFRVIVIQNPMRNTGRRGHRHWLGAEPHGDPEPPVLHWMPLRALGNDGGANSCSDGARSGSTVAWPLRVVKVNPTWIRRRVWANRAAGWELLRHLRRRQEMRFGI